MTGAPDPMDVPLRLAAALALAFPRGGMTIAGLRTEARAGRLAIERIAGKDFTTLRAIEEMRAACRLRKAPDSGCGPSDQDAASAPSGLSGTDPSSVRLAAARLTLEGLSALSPTISPASTTPPKAGAAIRLRPACPTSSHSTPGRSPARMPGPPKPRGDSRSC